jgi:transcription-repair coupling factor (superfamily II helicase)
MKIVASIPPRRSALIAEYAQKHSGPVIVVLNQLAELDLLMAELAFFLQDSLPIYCFPDWETLPYDPFSPHTDIISERIRLLSLLPQLERGIVVVGAHTLLNHLPPPSFIEANSFSLKLGDQLNLAVKRQRLSDAGYHAVDAVFAHGEYSVRGSIFDIFPMGAKHPFRLDLFDDTIDSIRDFDCETQRSLNKLESVQLLPAHEFPLDKHHVQHFVAGFEKLLGPLPQSLSPLQKGFSVQGLEYYLPLFFDQTAHFFDYCPKHSLIITEEHLESHWQQAWVDIQTRYQDKHYDLDRPPLPPKLIFFQKELLFSAIKPFERVDFVLELHKTGPHRIQDAAQALPHIDLSTPSGGTLLQNFIKEHADYELLICAETESRVQLLSEQLKRLQINHPIIEAPFQKGWIDPARKTIVLPEAALFPQKTFPKASKKKEADLRSDFERFSDFSELNVGDIVVHIEHGIGCYKGLSTLQVQDSPQEFLTIAYHNNDLLYVPVQDLHLLSRYSVGGLTAITLHQLGSDKWQRTKEKAAKRITDIAAELLQIYAERMSKPGFSYTLAEEDFAAFCADFPYTITEDQAKAVTDILRDMQSPHPMDRLLCGDVGFGKTEVAMRAAFLAIQNNKQVVVLVPTTLLAEQHFESFVNRFAKWPIKIAHFSRSTSSKQEAEIRQKLASGQIDLIIGTHKLIRSPLTLKDLGLIIIDEEHRFGVKDKEKLKTLRSDTDILAMTATPIPRTLNFSLSMLRDLSIIATPPAKRLSIKTFVKEYQKPIIKEAILREVLRGGQVYYLHNEVATIEATRSTLQEMLPQLSFSIVHGQMRPTEIEKVMADFYHNRSQVLICSTIVETGIDVPNANTIIMERADLFGLAQLHQLRGRVGRSHHQAYAYLLTPSKEALTPDAKKRLEAIEKSTELGAGFTLASHDLEIRGAGEILGAEQSGHMEDIGFSLYHELLDRAVNSLKNGQKLQPQDLLIREDSEVELNIPRLFPEEYVSDVHTRLQLYQRLQKIKTESGLFDFKMEVIDRFGPLPPAAVNLIASQDLKLKARHLGIKRIEAYSKEARLVFSASPQFEPLKLIKLIQAHSGLLQLKGQEQLTIKKSLPQADDRLHILQWILKELS